MAEVHGHDDVRRDLAGADDVGLGAGEGERRGIAGEQPPHFGMHVLDPTGGRLVHRRDVAPPDREVKGSPVIAARAGGLSRGRARR